MNKILLSELITAITDAANNFTGAIIKPQIHADAQSYYLDNEDSAVAVALILNELIFNAIKHSGQSKNSIIVQINYLDQKVEITVRNPYPGNAPDFNYAKNIGLGAGLNLIKSLVPKHGADLTIHKHDNLISAKLTLTEPVITTANDKPESQKQIA